MIAYQLLADMVVVFHLLFILFVLFGGLLLRRCPKLVWLHLPAVCWGVVLEVSGGVCPLTPLENWLRTKSFGSSSYATSFTENYLMPIIYPQALTHELQWVLALMTVSVNVLVYVLVFRSRKKRI